MAGALPLSSPQERFSLSFLVIADPAALPAVSMLTAQLETQAGFKAHGSHPMLTFMGRYQPVTSRKPISFSIRYDLWFLFINMSRKGGQGLQLAASIKSKENGLPEYSFLPLLAFRESARTLDQMSAKGA